jgi:oligopeptide transport system substrate-binding protein
MLLAGCGGGPTPADLAAKEGILLLGNGAEPQGLDPHLVTGLGEHRILRTLFEGLTDLDPVTHVPIPAAAERWDVSDDGLVYTFYLRENGTWSTGDPVTAHDFVYAWRRILSPKLGAECSYMLWVIRNAEAYNKGQISDFSEVGVEAVDDRTLRVTLAHPTPYFLTMHVHQSYMPVRQSTIEAFGAIDERGTGWTSPESLVGNGPFVLSAWEPNEVLSVRKRADYWDAASVGLNGVDFLPIDDEQTEERSFRVGEMHVTQTVPSNKIPVYQKHDPERIRIAPYFGTYFYRFNVTQPGLDDARVRRALAMSVDRVAIVERVTRGGEQPVGFLTPPGVAGYAPPEGIPYDPQRARELLAEAGYPNGQGFPAMEILYNTSDSHRRIAEAIQQMWKDTLGIEVNLYNQDWKVFLASQNNADYDIVRGSWIGDYLDPMTFLDVFVTNGGNNRTGWSSPRYDALIAQANGTADPAARAAVLREAEALLLEEAPLLPIYVYTRLNLISPHVKNWHDSLIGEIFFKELRLEPVS